MITPSINPSMSTDEKAGSTASRAKKTLNKWQRSNFFLPCSHGHFNPNKQYDGNKELKGRTHFMSQIPYRSSLKILHLVSGTFETHGHLRLPRMSILGKNNLECAQNLGISSSWGPCSNYKIPCLSPEFCPTFPEHPEGAARLTPNFIPTFADDPPPVLWTAQKIMSIFLQASTHGLQDGPQPIFPVTLPITLSLRVPGKSIPPIPPNSKVWPCFPQDCASKSERQISLLCSGEEEPLGVFCDQDVVKSVFTAPSFL